MTYASAPPPAARPARDASRTDPLVPADAPIRYSVHPRRRAAGWLLATVGLPLLTLALEPLRAGLGLPSVLLLYLLLVVVVSAVGGTWPAIAAALAAALIVNWYFTPPLHTWTIADAQHALALVVFLVVGGVLAVFVELAARRAGEAASARADAFAAEVSEQLVDRRLRRASAEAEALSKGNELRTALLAAVSHDLRTPLSSIKASVTSLRQHDVEWSSDETDEFLATIEEETDRLNDLVGNLLDMSRLQTGALQLALAPVGLEEVVAAALASLGSRVGEVTVEVPETLPRVVVDPTLLERAVANLVSNAVAWSPPDEAVRVTASVHGEHVRLMVVDRGPGIPVADRERVFQPFQRRGDRDRGGVGLGLAVARGFVQTMGGSLLIEDTPGGGSTMAVEFPARPHGDPAR